jgi:hypothetical protein
MAALNTLSPASRIWIYQSNKAFDPVMEIRMKERAGLFLDDWTSHGSKMQAAVEILHNRFVVVAVDEQTAPASGCGIDKSLRFIQQVEIEFQLQLLDRMSVAYEKEGVIQVCSLKEFEEMLKSGEINGETWVYNNLAENLAQLNSSWRLPLHKSWHARFLPVN